MSLNVPFIKIGSGDANNFLLVEHIAKRKYPIVLSTGMQYFSTIRKTYDLILKHHHEVAVLHCVSSYPTDLDDVNLRVLELYKTELPEAVIGYSGHETGIIIPLAAVALGAKVIEKHFTRDKCQKGSDHRCSLDPIEMENMVRGIREVERALGIPVKRILPCEEACRLKLSKSIVTTQRLLVGTKLELSNIAIKVSHPIGINPEEIFNVIGAKVVKNIEEDESISYKDLDYHY